MEPASAHAIQKELMAAASPAAQKEYLDGMTASLGSPQAALEMLSGIIQRDAFVMTYNDVFFAMGAITLVTVPLVLFLKPLPKNLSLSMH